MIPVAAAAAGVQGVLGVAQMIQGSIQQKKLMRQIKPFETPEEVTKILNATQSAAQGGYDPFTLSYMTNQVDRAASEAMGTAARLGADPNDLSSLLDQRIQGIMKIGAENANLNMANVSRYLGALEVVGDNKEAEWASEQNIIKDRLQAANQNKQAGLQNLGGAMNAAISLSSAAKTANIGTTSNVDIDTDASGNVISTNIPASRTSVSGVQSLLSKYGGFQPATNVQAPASIPNISASNYLNVRQAVQGILPNNPAIRYR